MKQHSINANAALVVEIGLWFAYFVYGNSLNRSAIACIAEESKRANILALFDSKALGETGRVLRRKAMRFWIVGGVLLLLILLLLGYLQQA